MSSQREASFYRKEKSESVTCLLCPHNCVIKPGKTGICGVRSNSNGTLFSDIYGKVSAVAMDPIEKKPLYHFYPGREILSIGTVGCNLKCSYCQNWHISQDTTARTTFHDPEKIIAAAGERNSIGIAYTYSEPIVWFEYVRDVAQLARERSLKNVMVTNGCINPEPLKELLTFTDAMNIDLKAFKEETYKKYQKGSVEAVKNTIRQVHEAGCHLEITTLVVTGMNDDIAELREIVDFIADISPAIPWHVSRYYPGYKYEEPATDIDFITGVCKEASEKLEYVYSGNIPSGAGGSNTLCPSCGAVAIERNGYKTVITGLDGNRCRECGTSLNIKN